MLRVPTALSKNHQPLERLALVVECSTLSAQLDFARGQSPASLFIFPDIVIPNEVRDLMFADKMQIPHFVRDDNSSKASLV